MKKILIFALTLVMALTAIPGFMVSAAAVSEVTYSEHLDNNNTIGYDYDITGCSIAWVKQATGALIWVTEDDARSDDEIIAQAKDADSSLANATKTFAVLKGEGIKNTPNKNGSQAKITEPENPVVPESGEKVNLRIETALKMAVKFEDGTVYYDGEMKEVVVGTEYLFQMCTVNWENGIYDENGNGLCGTVVYRVKVVHEKEFVELRNIAVNDPARYTVKGFDIIDNVAKTIIINCDAADFHLETDVNNFFVAYRFHFKNGDYNKQTGIENVVNTPIESLSVNLPVGTTVKCDAYKAYNKIDSDNVLINRNSGEGKYADVLLSSVNDYYWNH